MESFGWANKCNFKQVSIHQAAFKACTPQGVMSPQYFTKDDHVESNKILSLSHRLVCKELQNPQSQTSLRSNAKSSVAD